MERAEIRVRSDADRLVMDCVRELRPLFERLRGSVVVVGGLMTRVWFHARPIPEIVPRATIDVDLGVDRKRLGIASESELVRPLLNDADFYQQSPQYSFRFSKKVGAQRELLVDVLVAPGASRLEPPMLEKGVPTIEAPGLAYALLRGPTELSVEFVAESEHLNSVLPLPHIDAAFVLKGALMAQGSRFERRTIDTVDAITLAALCANDREAVQCLASHRRRSDVKRALGWLESGFTDQRSAAAGRAEDHFGVGMGAWSVRVAQRLLDAVNGR